MLISMAQSPPVDADWNGNRQEAQSRYGEKACRVIEGWISMGPNQRPAVHQRHLVCLAEWRGRQAALLAKVPLAARTFKGWHG